MAEQAASESSPDTDRDFDPSAEMLIHDYDDEQTLDEEEAMSNGGESVMNELVALQQESEMPMEELLAMYGYGRETNEAKEAGVASTTTNETNMNSEEESIGPTTTTTTQPMVTDAAIAESVDNSDPDKSNSEQESVVPSQMAILLTADPMEASTDEDEEDDEDYEPDNEENWKKNVQVGSDYQAVVPDGQELYGDNPVYEGEDRLLWDPKNLTDSDIEKYLEQVQTHNFSTAQGVHAIPAGSHVRDDEQALYLLLNCDLNLDEALRRHKLQSVPTSDPMSLWSEEECRNFELGLRTYGKDFFANQQNKVRTRSVKELVQFYYLWKKTERHDAFAARTRLEKKKYALHPGITDYMDRFLDEHENLSEPHDQMTSPNIRSLLYGDPKRQDGRSSEDFTAALEIVQKVANSSTVDFLLPGKFREDMQTVVLGSIDAHSNDPVSEIGRYGSGGGGEVPFVPPVVVDALQPQLSVLYAASDNVRSTLPVSTDDVGLRLNKNSDCLGRVVDLDDESEGLPPLKRPRLQSPVPPEDLLPSDGFTADPNDAVPSSVVPPPQTSACLSPALDSVSLTSSTVSSSSSSSTLLASALSSAVVPTSVGIPCGRSESNDDQFTLSDCNASGSMVGAVSADPGSLVASGSAIVSTGVPPSGLSSVVLGLPFDSASTLCLALEPNVGLDGEDALTIESMNPGFQRLTSLDSIEPSIPPLDTSIDSYASVLAVPGIALETMTMDSLTSMLDGFNPDATSGCPPPPAPPAAAVPVDSSSSGAVSTTADVVAPVVQDDDCCSAGDVVPATAEAEASAVVIEKMTENDASESSAEGTAACSVDSSNAATLVVHSVASVATGSENVVDGGCDMSNVKSVDDCAEECRPDGTSDNPLRDGEEVSDNAERSVTETTLTQAAALKVVGASSEQTPGDETKTSVSSPDTPELIIDVPTSDVEPALDAKSAPDGEPAAGLRPVSDAGATVDNLNNEVDRLSGNQLNIADVTVCEALVTEHSTSALST